MLEVQQSLPLAYKSIASVASPTNVNNHHIDIMVVQHNMPASQNTYTIIDMYRIHLTINTHNIHAALAKLNYFNS